MIMPFGKHRGKRLNEIPLDYLKWVLDTCTNASPFLREEIRRILLEEAESHDEQCNVLCAPGLVSQWYRQLSREFHPDLGGSHDGINTSGKRRNGTSSLLVFGPAVVSAGLTGKIGARLTKHSRHTGRASTALVSVSS
jgi:hypothetical protein